MTLAVDEFIRPFLIHFCHAGSTASVTTAYSPTLASRQHRTSTRAARCAEAPERCPRRRHPRATADARASLSLLRWPHDHHRDLRARLLATLSASGADRRDQDRHLMTTKLEFHAANLLVLCTGFRLATITLARTRGLGLKSSPDRHRLPSPGTAEATSSAAPTPLIIALDPNSSHPPPHVQRPNRHRACMPPLVSIPAISSPGSFRTPTPSFSVRRRRPSWAGIRKPSQLRNAWRAALVTGTIATLLSLGRVALLTLPRQRNAPRSKPLLYLSSNMRARTASSLECFQIAGMTDAAAAYAGLTALSLPSAGLCAVDYRKLVVRPKTHSHAKTLAVN